MTLKLSANLRQDLGKKSARIREAGKIPAVIYGHKFKNVNLELGYVEFEKILAAAGESTVVDVAIDGQPAVKAIISDVQYEPTKGRIWHVDLHQINMKEKINAHVELKFISESRAVKEENGVVVHNISELEIRCLPADLLHEVIVDISRLGTLDDVITIKDLNIPANIEVLHHHADDVVASVAKHREEKIEEPVAAVPAEGEAPAEGAAEGVASEKVESENKEK
jgi:large subunit ribosomal protein L25